MSPGPPGSAPLAPLGVAKPLCADGSCMAVGMTPRPSANAPPGTVVAAAGKAAPGFRTADGAAVAIAGTIPGLMAPGNKAEGTALKAGKAPVGMAEGRAVAVAVGRGMIPAPAGPTAEGMAPPPAGMAAAPGAAKTPETPMVLGEVAAAVGMAPGALGVAAVAVGMALGVAAAAAPICAA